MKKRLLTAALCLFPAMSMFALPEDWDKWNHWFSVNVGEDQEQYFRAPNRDSDICYFTGWRNAEGDITIPETACMTWGEWVDYFDEDGNWTNNEYKEFKKEYKVVGTYCDNGGIRDNKYVTSITIPDSVEEIGPYSFNDNENLREIIIGKGVKIIGHCAFQSNKNITSVTIPDSVEEIGESSFAQNASLQSVELGKGVNHIGREAFVNAQSLESINFPEGLISIGDQALLACSSLTSIRLPESLESIGKQTFATCSSLREIIMPSNLEELPYGLFIGCSSLASISLPNSIKTIGNNCFSRCSSLSGIELPNSIKTIGNDCFASCSSLASIELPENLESIGRSCFIGCEALTQINIPGKVSRIEENTFSGDTNLKSVSFWYGPTPLVLDKEASLLEITDLYLDRELEIETYEWGHTNWNPQLEKLTIGKNLTKIDFRTLGDSTRNIPRVEIEDWNHWWYNVELNGLYACPYSRGNSEVHVAGMRLQVPTLEEGMTEIPDYKLCGFKIEGDYKIPSTIKKIGAYSFYNNADLYSVNFPEGLEEIGNYAFNGCNILSIPAFPETLKSIGGCAFRNCKNIAEVKFPEGLENLGSSAFENSTSLKKAILFSSIPEIPSGVFRGCINLESLYLPQDITSIGDLAFYDCRKLEEVLLPSTVERIGNYAFYSENNWDEKNRCNLSSINFPESLKSIGSYAFANQQLSSLKFNKGLESIGEYAFMYNVNLHEITFEDGLKSIGSGAFFENNAINSIVLPNSLETIGNHAFGNLSEISLGDNVKELGEAALGNPKVMTLGAGVTKISKDVIDWKANDQWDKNQLRLLRVKASKAPTITDPLAFTDTQREDIVVVVNNGAKDSYMQNPRWKEFIIIEENESEAVITLTGETLAEEIRMQSGLMPGRVSKLKVISAKNADGNVYPLTDNDFRIIRENMVSLTDLDLSGISNTVIPAAALKGMPLLSHIQLSDKTTEIGYAAFDGNDIMTMDRLPRDLVKIESHAFNGNKRLQLTEIPDKVEFIGSWAFNCCYSMKELTFGPALETIEGGAFQLNYALEFADLAETKVKRLEGSTFNECRNLREIILPEGLESIGGNSYVDEWGNWHEGGSAVFANTNLRNIDFPEGLKEIGSNSFSQTGLRAVNVPEGVKRIESNTFANCKNLLSVSLPQSTESVGTDLFTNSGKLMGISCRSVEAPEAETGAFNGIRKRTATLTVPNISFKKYLNAAQWGMFSDLQNRLTVEIGDGADVTNIDETTYQEELAQETLDQMANEAAGIAEDEVEDEEEVEEGQGDEQQESRKARRAAARKKTQTALKSGMEFTKVFDGSMVASGESVQDTRYFINTRDGAKVVKIEYNGEDITPSFEGGSFVIKGRNNGSLKIVTEGYAAVDTIVSDKIGAEAVCEVFTLQGAKVYTGVRSTVESSVPAGIYIIRSGKSSAKIIVK